MKHKTESWNGATLASDSASLTVRRSLTRALQLGQLSHVVSGALSTFHGSASPRGAAQNRMRALLNQDRALLSHRACGEASLENENDELERPSVPLKGAQTRGAAQNRMRELLNQDRALLALREAQRRQNPGSEPLDDDFASELVQLVDREWTPVHEATSVHSTSATVVQPSATTATVATTEASVSRGTCLGATATFVAEPQVVTVCTPGPVHDAATATPAAAATSVSASAPAEPARVARPIVFPAPEAPKVPAPSPRPAPVAPVAVSQDSAGDPIRTRGMAKLLALQGYRDRALSIYDELIAAEPDNAELRAEADRLRN
jgi:hypothetical protein